MDDVRQPGFARRTAEGGCPHIEPTPGSLLFGQDGVFGDGCCERRALRDFGVLAVDEDADGKRGNHEIGDFVCISLYSGALGLKRYAVNDSSSCD